MKNWRSPASFFFFLCFCLKSQHSFASQVFCIWGVVKSLLFTRCNVLVPYKQTYLGVGGGCSKINIEILKQQQSEWLLIFVHCWWFKKKSPHVIIVNTLLCGHCNIWGVGQGGKVAIVHVSLASIQSSVQNIMLFCKKRFMIFKINLVNLFLVVIFFKTVIFQMAEFPPTCPQTKH